MNVFWSQGYNATALPDLLEATRLSRGSLYAAFGDKHGLFLKALDRYISDALARMDDELGTASPIAGLRKFLDGYVARTEGASGRRGCLLVATAMELAGHDPEVDRRISNFFAVTESKIESALSRVKAVGELAEGCDPASAARVLLCFVEGMRVVGKSGPKPETTQKAINALVTHFSR